MKLNKPLLRKMIERIETMPETYEQSVIVASDDHDQFEYEEVLEQADRQPPMCGTVACLAGEAIICNAESVEAGIEELKRLDERGKAADRAQELLGLSGPDAFNLFFDWNRKWPEPFRQQFSSALNYKERAFAATGLLKAILKTDGKILEQ